MSDPPTLVRMATSKPFSLLSVADLAEAGLDRHLRAELVREGRLHRVRRGFYAATGQPAWEQSLGAAYLHVGHSATVSHRSAARLHGLRRDNDLDLTIRYPNIARAKGVSVHRSRDIADLDIELLGDFRATTLPRTLCDLGLVLPPCEVERLIDHSIATGLVKPTDLYDMRMRVGEHGRTGVSMVDSAIGDLPEFAHLTDSGPELRLYKIINRSSVPNPIPQIPVRARGHQYYVDLGYPDFRVALEYDGHDFHSTPEQLEYDRRRQLHIESIGWIVLRYVWADLEQLAVPHTLMRIREALHQENLDL